MSIEMVVIIKAFILILLLSFIMSCSRLEIEPDFHFDMPYSHTDFPCVAPMVVILLSDGSTMGWDCLPDSVKDGELRMDWKRYPESQRQGKLVLFAVYLSGPYQGRAYRPRKDDLGKHIVRDGKKGVFAPPSQRMRTEVAGLHADINQQFHQKDNDS